jgi:hypothetical protein
MAPVVVWRAGLRRGLGGLVVLAASALFAFPAHGAAAVTAASAEAMRVDAIALGSLGVLAVAFGTVTGYSALEHKGTAEDHCSASQRICDARGAAANEKGRRLAVISGASFALGGLSLLGGFVLFQTGKQQAAIQQARLAVSSLPAGAELQLTARW